MLVFRFNKYLMLCVGWSFIVGGVFINRNLSLVKIIFVSILMWYKYMKNGYIIYIVWC